MKWSRKPDPKEGDVRNKSAFLFTPKTIGNQTRWLEWATWAEEYRVTRNHGVLVGEWQAISWREDKK